MKKTLSAVALIASVMTASAAFAAERTITFAVVVVPAFVRYSVARN